MSPIRLVLVRHGDTTGGSATRFYGRTDLPLSDQGRRQMERAKAALATERFERVVTSPLTRARTAAELMAPPGVEPVVEPRFSEVDFGHWEGWTLDEIRDRAPEDYARWRGSPETFDFPGAEPRERFRDRVDRAILEQLRDSAAATLVVAHKGIIRQCYRLLLSFPVRELRPLPVELGSIHRMERHASRWYLTSAPDVRHLGADRQPGT